MVGDVIFLRTTTARKDSRINIRLSDRDLAGIQRKAVEQCIPYQSVISALIHRFVEGQLPTRANVSVVSRAGSR